MLVGGGERPTEAALSAGKALLWIHRPPALPDVPQSRKPPRLAACVSPLLDDLDDAMRARIDQHGTIVDHRVAIVAHTVFRRHVIVGDALLGQVRANSDVTLIGIGGVVPFDDITVKARPFIDTENAGHAADDSSDRA